MQKSISSQRLEPKKLIQRTVYNINKISLKKYGFSSDFVEKKHWTMKGFGKFTIFIG